MRRSPGLRLSRNWTALFLLGLLEPRPTGQHDVVAVLVELDDLGLDLLADVGLEIADPAQLDERRREEAAQTDVDDQAALDDLDDLALDHALGFLDLFDLAPGPLVLGPLLGQDEATVLVFLGDDERFDALAHRHDLVGVDVVANRELAARDHAFGLVADVQEDFVAIDLDHGAVHELAVLDGDHGGGVGVVHVLTFEVIQDDLSGLVALDLESGGVGGGVGHGNFFASGQESRVTRVGHRL